MDNIFEKNNSEDMAYLIAKVLERNANRLRDIPVIVNEQFSISHIQLNNYISVIVESLKKEIPKNACVVVRCKNIINLYLLHLSLLKMGIPQAFINPYENKEYQMKSIKSLNANLIIQDIPLDDILMDETFFINSKLKLNRLTSFKINQNKKMKNISSIVLGSGTTGEKKLLAFNTKRQYLRYKNTIEKTHGKEKERFFCFTSAYNPHARFSMLLALLKGMTIVLPNKNPVNNLVSFCNKYKIEHLQLTADQALNILIKSDKSSSFENKGELKLPLLKSCVVSNSLISENIRKTILSRYTKNLFIVYGTNEFGIISEATPEDIKTHPGTVGKPFNNISLKIVDDEGKDCKLGEVGNILVKSNSMMNEYHNNKNFTKEAFSKDGFYPGDLGRLTDDGNLIFEGRKDDMMIITGENIYPRELESLLESHPKVIESAVFPLTVDGQAGIPYAVVTINEKVEVQELKDFCFKYLGWRAPQEILISNRLPKNNMGKVLKNVLAKKIVNYFNTR